MQQTSLNLRAAKELWLNMREYAITVLMGNVSEKLRSKFMKSTAIFSGAMLIVGALCVSGCVSDSSLNAVSEVTVDDYEARVFTS